MKMSMSDNLPSSVFAQAWVELYKCFGERCQDDEMDLMESVLQGVVAEYQEDMKVREETDV